MVNLAITVALGVISVGLGAFAIWLSLQFHQQSAAALRSVEGLISELRGLTTASLDQQKQFSSRMLDSILGPYGQTSDGSEAERALTQAIRDELSELETRVVNSIAAVVGERDADPARIAGHMEAIRDEIAELTDRAASTAVSSSALPEHLRDPFLEWRAFPAHFNILWAVVAEGASSTSEVEEHAEAYGIPRPAGAGIRNLLDNKVLSGTPEKFEIPSQVRPSLAAWIVRNRHLLEELRDIQKEAILSGIEDDPPDNPEFRKKMQELRSIARRLEI